MCSLHYLGFCYLPSSWTLKDPGHTALQEYSNWDFPGGSVVKSLLANAGDPVSIPGPGRFRMPQSNKAPQVLSPCSRARAPQGEKPSQWQAHAPQLGSPPTATKTQCRQNSRKFFKKKTQIVPCLIMSSVIKHRIMDPDSLISILKDSGKHCIYSGDSESEMRLIGIVSCKMPGKGEDFPQAASATAPFLQTEEERRAFVFFCFQSFDYLSQKSRISGKPSLKIQSLNFKENRKLLWEKEQENLFQTKSATWRFSALYITLSDILCYQSENTSVYTKKIILRVLEEFIYFYLYLINIYRSFASYQAPTYLLYVYCLI